MLTSTNNPLGWLIAFVCCAACQTATGQLKAEELWTIGAELRAVALPVDTPDLAGARVATYPLQFHAARLHPLSHRGGAVSLLRTVGGVPALVGQTFAVRLPASAALHMLEVHTVREEVPGIITYSGVVDGDSAALFTLTFDDGRLLGKIHHADRTYLIQVADDHGNYVMHEIDKRRLLPPHSPGHEHGPKNDADGYQVMSNPSCSSYAPNNDNGNVRVLFLYTPNAASQAPGGIISLVNQIIAEHNQSAFNSEVDAKNYISFAGMQVVNDEFPGDCKDFILQNRMADEVGVFSGLRASMSQHSADVAFLVLTEDPSAPPGPFCPEGWGRLGGAAFAYRPSDPFALSTVTYAVGDLTAPHELGHVMGGQHTMEGGSDLVDGAPDCARGHIIKSGEFQTMMGGYDHQAHCPFALLPGPQSCIRLPLWSNPDRYYQVSSNPPESLPTGHAQDAHMARALNMTMTEVALWDDSHPTPRPSSAPSAPTVQSHSCFGLNTVYWSAISGVEHFQLWASLSSSPSDWSLVYHGMGTGSAVSVPSGEAMNLRLRGCNGNGCSDYSTLAFAFYYPGCT